MVKKKAKGTSFRLKQDAAWALADLAKRWECSQTAALERAILEAHESPFSSGTKEFSIAELKVEYDETA